MRVVYDTSVLATILSRRELVLLLQADVLTGRITLVSSPYILEELERVLTVKFGMTKQAAKSRARLLGRVADVVRPKAIPRVSRDTNDDPILAAALESDAEYVVTLDQDLLILKQYASVRIVTLDEFKEVVARLD